MVHGSDGRTWVISNPAADRPSAQLKLVEAVWVGGCAIVDVLHIDEQHGLDATGAAGFHNPCRILQGHRSLHAAGARDANARYVGEMERRLRLNEDILRFRTLRVDVIEVLRLSCPANQMITSAALPVQSQ